MKLARIASTILLAGGIAGSLLVGGAPAQAEAAATGPDLDVTSCFVYDDPIDYGDGIDWWKIGYTYTNEGNVSTGVGFNVRTNFDWQPFVGNEVSVDHYQAPMAPGASQSYTMWLTKHIVDQRTWGVFLDTGHVVADVQINDNFCSFYVNNT